MIGRLAWVVGRIAGVVVVLAGTALLVAASLAPSASVAANAVGGVASNVLSFPPLPERFAEPAERSVILARDGSRIAILRDENREVVSLAQIPTHVIDAVVATEDASFFAHRGVNWRAIVRAAVGNARAGTVRSGASTITQQLVKALTAQDDPTLERKLREAYWAVELERRLSKEQILEEYLNRAYFGNGVYGLGTAAEFYFSKPVSDLTIVEGALFAGMIRAPEVNDPLDAPAAAVGRRNIVLAQMADNGLLDAAEAQRLATEPLRLRPQPQTPVREPFFVTYVRTLLAREPALGPDPASRLATAATGGLVIRTTLDRHLDRAADAAIRDVLAGPGSPQAALTAVDPRSGAILAVGVGPRPFGSGPGQTEVTPAVPGLGSPFGRQPGSAFKAFAVVAALEEGVAPGYTVDTPSPYVPARFCTDVAGQPPWRPGNYSDGGGGELDLARATAVSSNVWFAGLVDKFLGPERLVDVARRLGVTGGQLDPHCAAVLGSEDVYGLDMASAFATIANGGVACAPFAIVEIVDRHGRTIARGGNRCTQAVDPAVAGRAAQILRGPIEAGTASRHGTLDRPAFGKTGTTQDYRDAWFAGAIPQLSAAVWVGHEQPAPLADPRCSGGQVTGGCLPTMIWQRFMTAATSALALPVQQLPPAPPPPSAPIPDVEGMAEAAAVEALAAASFRSYVEVVTDYRPAGTAVGTNPPAGTAAPRGGILVLQVSDGTGRPPAAPDVVGLLLEEASALLEEANLDFEIVRVPVDDPADLDRVVRQRPAAGAPVDAVEVITLYVGRARTAEERPSPQPEPVPTGTSTVSPRPQPSEPPGEGPPQEDEQDPGAEPDTS